MRAQRVVGKARLMLNLVLACFLVLSTVVWRNPGAVRQAIYTVFREYVQAGLFLDTREYQVAESAHFQVRYRDQDAAVIPLILATAEKIYQPINEQMGFTPSGKVSLVVYPNTASLQKSFGWDANQNAMGVYWMGTIRLLSPNAWIGESEPARIKKVFQQIGPMAHEYTHLVVDYQTKGNYTRWLTEGIAQYQESRLSGISFEPPDRLNLSEQLYTLNQLDRTFDIMPDQDLAYWEALSTVDFIVAGHGEGKLKDIIAQLGQGQNLNTVFQHELGCTKAEFENQWRQWVKKNYDRTQ